MSLPGRDPSLDLERTGGPAWGKRDTGPLNTYLPGPISNEPLSNSYNTGVRLGISGLLFGAVIVFVVVRGQAGVVGSVLVLLALWSLYAVPVWLRGRVGLRVDGDRCEVHGWFRTVSFTGAEVEKVQYVFAGRSPDVRLVLRDGRKVVVVASRIEKGHSTLFEWLRRYAPDAMYDEKSLDVRNMLVTRGLMGAPGDSWDATGPVRRVGKQSAEQDRVPGESPGGVDVARVPGESPGEDAVPTRVRGGSPGEDDVPTRVPEEHRDEVAVRLEGPTPDKDTVHTRVHGESPGEDAVPTRVPEEHRDEVAVRLEGPDPSDPGEAPTGSTPNPVRSSMSSPPASPQVRRESEDR